MIFFRNPGNIMPNTRPLPRPSFLSEDFDINVSPQPVSIAQLIGYPSRQQINERIENLRQLQQSNMRPLQVEMRPSARSFLAEFNSAAYRTQQQIGIIHNNHESTFRSLHEHAVTDENLTFRTQYRQAQEYWNSLYCSADTARVISKNTVYRLWNLLAGFAVPNTETANTQSIVYQDVNTRVLNPINSSFLVEIPNNANSGLASPYVMNLHSKRRTVELQGQNNQLPPNFYRSIEGYLGCSAEALPRVIKKINLLLKTWFPRTKGRVAIGAPTRNEAAFNAYPHILVEKVPVIGQQTMGVTYTSALDGPTNYYYKLYFINFSTIIPALISGRVAGHYIAAPGFSTDVATRATPVLDVDANSLQIRWIAPHPVLYLATRQTSGRVTYRRARENVHFTGSWLQYIPPRINQEDLRQQEEIRRALRDSGTYIPDVVVQRPASYQLTPDRVYQFIIQNLERIALSTLVSDDNRDSQVALANTILRSNGVVSFTRVPGNSTEPQQPSFERNIVSILTKIIQSAFEGYSRTENYSINRSRIFRTDNCSEIPGYPFIIRSEGRTTNYFTHPLADSRIISREGQRTFFQPLAFSCQFKFKRSYLENLFLVGEQGPLRNRSNMKNEIHQVLRKVNVLAGLLGFKITTKMVRISGEENVATKQRIFIIENLFVPTQNVYANEHFLKRFVETVPQTREVPGFFRRLSLNEELSRFLAEFGTAVTPAITSPQVIIHENIRVEHGPSIATSRYTNF